MVGNVLKSHVKILADLRFVADYIEQVPRKLVRIGVMEAYPFHSWNVCHARNKLGNVVFAVQVYPIVG